jgi:hypothetical protein
MWRQTKLNPILQNINDNKWQIIIKNWANNP